MGLGIDEDNFLSHPKTSVFYRKIEAYIPLVVGFPKTDDDFKHFPPKFSRTDLFFCSFNGSADALDSLYHGTT